MSSVKILGSSTGTGTLTIAAPTTNVDRVLTLPTVSTTIVGANSSQTFTNVTIGSGLDITSSDGSSPTVTQTSVVTASGTEPLTIVTGLPSWIIRISVVMYRVSLTGTQRPLIQFGTGATPTWVTTGYNSGSDNYGASLGSVVTSTTGFLIGRTSTAASLWDIVYTFMRTNADDNVWVGSMRGITGGTLTTASGGGYITLAEPLTAIQLATTPAAGVFDGGFVSTSYG